ncbi:hypothetical protein T07_5284 [Trichinella nelsoni]|uniref:Uncharacterized protein n=2 Tax=Trichinella nelsoni TaxID=6336 RepID=A0A0V0RE49_9BILA|nr:hypothetical protein T07_5284 [Trichinella nelsoni]
MLPFFTISREIRNQGTWDQAHCCFLIFSYIPILFLEKNRFYENLEISWAIDFAVFAFWLHITILDSPANSVRTQSHTCGINLFLKLAIIKSDALHKHMTTIMLFIFSIVMIWKQMQQKSAPCGKRDENEVELVIIAIANIKVMHHTNIGITGTIRRNLQRTTISYKHIQLHMEKNSFFKIRTLDHLL